MRKCCCNCCMPFKPRYQRLVDNIFPVNPNDGLVRNNMEKLTFFALSSPEKLDRIGEYLAKRMTRDVSRKRYGFVFIAMEALDQLLIACHAQTLNLFVESFLKMVQKLLECEEPDLNILATNSFVKFANIEEDAPSYHRRYDFFISKFTAMCHNNNLEVRARIKIRKSGLKGIHAVIRKTVGDDLQVNIYEPEHMKKIVPSLLYNMHDPDTPLGDRPSVANTSTKQLNAGVKEMGGGGGGIHALSFDLDDERNEPNEVLLGPHVVTFYKKEKISDLAESCLRELVSRASLATLKSLLKPLMEHFDYHHLWDPPDTFAVKVLRLIMYSVKPQHTHVVIDMLLMHLEEHDDPYLKANIMRAISQIITLATLSSIGPSIHQWFNAMFVDLRKSVQTTSLDMKRIHGEEEYQQSIIHTMGEFAANLPDYQKIQVLIFIMNQVPLPDVHDRRDLMLFRRDSLIGMEKQQFHIYNDAQQTLGGDPNSLTSIQHPPSINGPVTTLANVDNNYATMATTTTDMGYNSMARTERSNKTTKNNYNGEDTTDTCSTQTFPRSKHDSKLVELQNAMSSAAGHQSSTTTSIRYAKVSQDSKGRFRTELVNENLTPSTSTMSSPVVIIDHPLRTTHLDDLTVYIIDPKTKKPRRFSLRKGTSILKKTSKSIENSSVDEKNKTEPLSPKPTVLLQSLPGEGSPVFSNQKSVTQDGGLVTDAESIMTPKTVETRRRNTKLQIMVLQSLLKVATKFTSIQYSATFPSNFLVPLLKMSVVLDKRVRLLVQEILHTLLDRHDNLPKLLDKACYQFLLISMSSSASAPNSTIEKHVRKSISAKTVGEIDEQNDSDLIEKLKTNFPAEKIIPNNNALVDSSFPAVDKDDRLLPQKYEITLADDDFIWSDLMIEKCSHLDMYFMRKNGPFLYSAIYESALRLNNDNSNIKSLLITISLLILELGSSQDIMIDIIKLLFALQKKCRDLPFIRPVYTMRHQDSTEDSESNFNGTKTLQKPSSNVSDKDGVKKGLRKTGLIKKSGAISNASVKSLDLSLDDATITDDNKQGFVTPSDSDLSQSNKQNNDTNLLNQMPMVEIFSLPAFLLELKIHSLLACAFSFLLRALDWWYCLYNVALDEQYMLDQADGSNTTKPVTTEIHQEQTTRDTLQSQQNNSAGVDSNDFNLRVGIAGTGPILPINAVEKVANDENPAIQEKLQQRDKVKALTDHVKAVLDARFANRYKLSKLMLPPKATRQVAHSFNDLHQASNSPLQRSYPDNLCRASPTHLDEEEAPGHRDRNIYSDAVAWDLLDAGAPLGDVFAYPTQPFLTGLPIPPAEMAPTSRQLLQDDELYFDIRTFKEALTQLGLDTAKLETPLNLKSLVTVKDLSTEGTPAMVDGSAAGYTVRGMGDDPNSPTTSLKSVSLSIESSSTSSNSGTGSLASGPGGDDNSYFFDPESGTSTDTGENEMGREKENATFWGLDGPRGSNDQLIKSKRRKNHPTIPTYQDINALSMKKIFFGTKSTSDKQNRAHRLKQISEWYTQAPFEEIMARSRCKEIESRKNMQQLIFNNITRSPLSFYDTPPFKPYFGTSPTSSTPSSEEIMPLKKESSKTGEEKSQNVAPTPKKYEFGAKKKPKPSNKDRKNSFRKPTTLPNLKFPQLIVY